MPESIQELVTRHGRELSATLAEHGIEEATVELVLIIADPEWDSPDMPANAVQLQSTFGPAKLAPLLAHLAKRYREMVQPLAPLTGAGHPRCQRYLVYPVSLGLRKGDRVQCGNRAHYDKDATTGVPQRCAKHRKEPE